MERNQPQYDDDFVIDTLDGMLEQIEALENRLESLRSNADIFRALLGLSGRVRQLESKVV